MVLLPISVTRYATQQPFELKLTMPKTARDGCGYSDKYVVEATKQLTN